MTEFNNYEVLLKESVRGKDGKIKGKEMGIRLMMYLYS